MAKVNLPTLTRFAANLPTPRLARTGTLLDAPQNLSPEAVATAVLNSPGARVMRREAAAAAGLRQELGELRSVVNRLLMGGGQFNSGDRRLNISPYVVPTVPGKGGVLPTNPASFAGNEVANTEVAVELPDWARSRMTGCYIEGISLAATGGMAAQGELAKVEFSLKVNDVDVFAVNRVPAFAVSQALDGMQILPANVPIGADTYVSVTFRVNITLTAATAGALFLQFWCGDGSSYAFRVR